MTLVLVAQGLQLLTAILAVMLARCKREYRPIAVFLCSNACADLIAWALSVWIPPPQPDGPVLSGLARVAANVDGALFLIWPATLAGTALWVFQKRRPWVVIPVWAAGVAALVVTYPTTRGAELQKWYLVAELAALAATLGAFVQWIVKREMPRLQHVAVMLVAGVDVASLIVGPWSSVIYETWPLSQLMSAVLYAIMSLIQGVALWTSGWRRLS